jgi:hypothetical protein
MIRLTSNASRSLFTTTRIVGERPDGTTSTGTGFFFKYTVDEQTFVPVLITNKHVVKGTNKGLFFIHESYMDHEGQPQPSENSFGLRIQNFENCWIDHPDEEIDLSAMPLASLHQQAQAVGKEPFYMFLDESSIPTQAQHEDLTAMEDLTMVGYPIGIWDDVNNLPILRRGITASHPATNFRGKSLGIVDIAAFPGSSGSPIFILNEGSSFLTPTHHRIGVTRLIFLGVIFAGPQHSVDGSIKVVDIPTKQVPIASTMIPAHLGYYIKSAEIIKLKEHLFSMMNSNG